MKNSPSLRQAKRSDDKPVASVVWGCMHLRHTRFDDWEIICKDCGTDLSDNLEAIAYYVPDSFMRRWYDYPPTPDSQEEEIL